MGEFKYLICVQAKNMETSEDANNNKYYKMEENDDGTFLATYGKVGAENPQKKIYDMSRWDGVYKQKTSKVRNGYIYKDITDLKTVVTSAGKGFKDVKDSKIQSLLNTLQKYSKKSLLDNYTVEVEEVGQAQIDEAQKIVDDLAGLTLKRKGSYDIEDVNDKLLELFSVIPRKMKKVKDFLLEQDYVKKDFQKIISNEQDTLDVMAQQVNMTQAPTNEEATLEDVLGIKLRHATKEEKDEVISMMGDDKGKFKNAWVVDNIASSDNFKKQREKSYKGWTKLLWHGSRNENWLNILKTSLMIRPAGAILTGAMFGNGIYFANKCRKSMGYTSLRGSYWASGNNSQGFMALYAVNTGKELRKQSHESWMYDLDDKKLKSHGDYDSLYAKGGIDLRNDEFIVYNQNQCTIKYLVEVSG